MSRHYQFETGMSMTGANADYRGMFKPSQEGDFVANLYNRISGIMELALNFRLPKAILKTLINVQRT